MTLKEIIERMELAQKALVKAARPQLAEDVSKGIQALRQIPDMAQRAADRDAALEARDAALIRAQAAEAKMIEMDGHPDVKALRLKKLQAAQAELNRQIAELSS